MKQFTVATLSFLLLATGHGQTVYQKDFQFYWQTIQDNFAYFNRQQTNWDQVKTIYQPAMDSLATKEDFIHLLERVNNELYNGHVFLNTNTPSSNRTIPSGSDLKVSWINNQFIISEIRTGFNAELAGLQPGMRILKYNGILMADAIQPFLPKSASKINKEMLEYAANMLLAGTHNTPREITVLLNKQEKTFYPDSIPNKTETGHSTLLETKLLPHNLGYIRINNSLGNSDLMKSFDLALDSLMHTQGMILDLRETPSGGNTTIARAIMGRFTSRELPYQKHLYTAEEKETGIKRTTLELVSPRRRIYTKPLIILVGYWTGSMGEGMAIGLDGMKRARIAGTKMAGLLGEIYSFEMPETKIPFSFPCVQLQHVNGQPREDFMPSIRITNQDQAITIAAALLVKAGR